MPERNHHHVAVIVGKSVHNDEVIPAPVENQVLFIPVLGGLVAEYAACRLLAEDVFDAPGCP
jgi:hypothetical protein